MSRTSSRRKPYPITASMSNGRNDGGKVTMHELRITDPRNGYDILEVSFDSMALMNMLNSRGTQPGFLSYVNTRVIGKHRHAETVFIPKGEKPEDFDFSPYEQDGWECRRGDYGNHHRTVHKDGVQGYSVHRTRLQDTPDPNAKDATVPFDAREPIVSQALDLAATHLLSMGRGRYVPHMLQEFTQRLGALLKPTQEAK